MQVTEVVGFAAVVFLGIGIENRNSAALISHGNGLHHQIPLCHLIFQRRSYKPALDLTEYLGKYGQGRKLLQIITCFIICFYQMKICLNDFDHLTERLSEEVINHAGSNSLIVFLKVFLNKLFDS